MKFILWFPLILKIFQRKTCDFKNSIFRHTKKTINIVYLQKIRPRSSMDRMSDSGSEGWGFESLRGHKDTKKPLQINHL